MLFSHSVFSWRGLLWVGCLFLLFVLFVFSWVVFSFGFLWLCSLVMFYYFVPLLCYIMFLLGCFRIDVLCYFICYLFLLSVLVVVSRSFVLLCFLELGIVVICVWRFLACVLVVVWGCLLMVSSLVGLCCCVMLFVPVVLSRCYRVFSCFILLVLL